MTAQPHHHAAQRVHTEAVVLDIGDDMGGLIFYTPADWRGREIEVLRHAPHAEKIHCEVDERLFNGRTLFTGVFPPLPAGEYEVCRPALHAGERFSVTAGHIQEIQWRA